MPIVDKSAHIAELEAAGRYQVLLRPRRFGKNLSLELNFNTTLGVTQTETQALLQPLAEACKLDAAAPMVEVTRWYNGYRFRVDAPEPVYNPDMVLYFIDQFDLKRCAYPDGCWMKISLRTTGITSALKRAKNRST